MGKRKIGVLSLFWLASLSFAAALSGALVPGPVFVIVVSESLKKGKRAGPLVVLGHLAIEALIISAIFVGLDKLLGSSRAATLVSYIGGSVLVLMGFYLTMTAKKFRTDTASNAETRFTSHGLVAAGLLSSSSNPHFFLWWFTTGVPIMALSLTTAEVGGFAAFLIGHATADLLWFSFISYSVDKGRRYLNRKTVRKILFGSAIFLVIFGLYLILTAHAP